MPCHVQVVTIPMAQCSAMNVSMPQFINMTALTHPLAIDQCKLNGCFDRVLDGLQVCRRHHICSVAGCQLLPSNNSSGGYCDDHRCREGSCRYQRLHGGEFCALHTRLPQTYGGQPRLTLSRDECVHVFLVGLIIYVIYAIFHRISSFLTRYQATW